MTNTAGTLEAEFRADANRAQARRADDVAHLAEITAAPRVVCSSGKSFVALGLLALPILAMALFVPMEWPVRIILAALALATLAASIVLYRMTRQPIMTLTAAGLVFSRSDARIPWSDVRDQSALLVNGNLSQLRLELRPDAPRPSFQPCLHRYRYDLRAKKELVFRGLGPLVGLDAGELLELVAMYREATRLRERQLPPA